MDTNVLILLPVPLIQIAPTLPSLPVHFLRTNVLNVGLMLIASEMEVATLLVHVMWDVKNVCNVHPMLTVLPQLTFVTQETTCVFKLLHLALVPLFSYLWLCFS